MSQITLDASLVQACLTGSANAYYAFYNPDHHPMPAPAGFASPPASFRGWDDFLDTPTGEPFALAYQHATDPTTVLVAFRGTASMWDALIDAFEYGTPFTPSDSGVHLPNDLYVARGFLDTYTGTDAGLPVSLQTDLFGYLRRVGARKVIVTGHSLGGALANLFAFDVALSLPAATVVNVTLASPRTGKGAWQAVYDGTAAGGGTLGDSTFRIENVRDVVPCLPLPNLNAYQHVGRPFKVEFWPSSYTAHTILSRHSLSNYTYVLERALAAQPQQWAGLFPDQSVSDPNAYPRIQSQAPTAADCSLLWEVAEQVLAMR